jgi:hypothetical protein
MLEFSEFDFKQDLEPDFSQVRLMMRVKKDYHAKVTDPKHKLYGTKAVVLEDYLTDGMSIPKWLQPIVGEPFEGNTLRAALFHDFLCFNQKIATQEVTHKLFELILKADGFPFWRRKAAYLAVVSYNRLKNPKWK